MKKTRKFLVLLFVACCAGMFAGCGEREEQGQNDNDISTTTLTRCPLETILPDHAGDTNDSDDAEKIEATDIRELSNPTIDDNGITTWDTVYFGHYWQNDTNGDGVADQNDDKEPVRWRVLSVEGDDAFLLADKNLDCQPYVDEKKGVTWEDCTIRIWLNNEFLNDAFTDSEQFAIQTTKVINNDNPVYGTNNGNETIDKVYLLSIDEVTNSSYGFSVSGSESLKALTTNYAIAQGAWIYRRNDNGEYLGIGDWLLRSRGATNASVSRVGSYVDEGGVSIADRTCATRPVLHLNLSSASEWSYAGQMTSDRE